MIITANNINELFHYNTGKVCWKKRPRGHFNTMAGCNGFNARYKGKEIGTITTHPRTGKQYRTIRFCGKAYSVHALVWLIHNGAWHSNTIDHINGNSLDNRIENIREVTQAENLKNKAMYKNNNSGVTGVWLNKKKALWNAYITSNGKRHHIGNFKAFEDAVSARKKAEKEYLFHDNHGK